MSKEKLTNKKIKGKTIKPVVFDSKNQELIGEFIGLFAGDGCLNKSKGYHYRVCFYFNITEKAYVTELKKVFYKLFNKCPMEFKRNNLLILEYCSKEIFNLVLNYVTWLPNKRKCHSVRLKDKKYDNKFKIGFLRGCLDSDGYLSDKKINFASSSPHLIKNIKSFLDDLKIKYGYSIYKEKRKNRVDMHHIDIRKKERYNFLNLIKPRETKNLNASAGSFGFISKPFEFPNTFFLKRFPDRRLGRPQS